MEIGYIIGWVGFGFGILVPIPQLYSLIKFGHTRVSMLTYLFLTIALACYLWHAIYIKSVVFTVVQSVNLTTNAAVLFLLLKRR